MSPISVMIRPSQKLQTIIRMIPTITMMPPSEMPPTPPLLLLSGVAMATPFDPSGAGPSRRDFQRTPRSGCLYLAHEEPMTQRGVRAIGGKRESCASGVLVAAIVVPGTNGKIPTWYWCTWRFQAAACVSGQAE